MNLPDSVREYLQLDLARRRRPFCFRIDDDLCLLEVWGNAAAHGLGDLHVGDTVADRAPYLVGHVGKTAEQLPFVTTPEGTFEIHILPGDGFADVIVLDASQAYAFHQQRQQTANELRLLHASQQKLIERQRALIGELVEAKTELDHRRREAERANAGKSQFIAMMSHEFRTPLASIVNYADLALEDDTSAEDIRKSAEAIARAARHMNRLVDTILDEARLEAGRLQLDEHPFDLHALFDDLAAIMAPLAAEKLLGFGIYVDGEVPQVVVADDDCLRQVLINLLGNAIKFTETGTVRLDVAWERGELRATVADTGPGIAVADQQRIFEAFERAGDGRGGAVPGTGLGLAITSQLVQLMRGSIELDAAPGAGCRVSITLPAPPASDDADDASTLPEPASEYRANRPATILVCDDDDDLLALAEYYLVRAGYGVLIARDGREAVDKALAYAPDMVLMDINIPRLSGSAAAAELRAKEFSAPIIALTASDVRKLDDRDFTGALRKPIQMPRLLAQIQAHI